MTLCCGLLRLDGDDVRRSTLTSMLASSSLGLPAARGVHLDGPFGVVTAAGPAGDPIPPIAVDDLGLTVVVVTSARPARVRLAAGPGGGEPGRGEPDDGARGGCAVACQVAAAYRSVGERCLRGLAPDKLVIVWDSAARRLLVARTGRLAADLLTWSDGRHIAFGTEPAQLLAAFRAPLFGLIPGPSVGGAPGPAPARPWLVSGGVPSVAGHEPAGSARPRRLGRVRQLAPGDLFSISIAVARRGPGGAGLRLVPRPSELEPGTARRD
ncbi:hypothetical protein [Pseudofrankia asymbiotica]|uniref:Uncharacterized protein n=1 Tax=Pseudofrankia asymbiotica TaxID=1834516 RepID=A0A1V2I563_9ACTN|nr:hypothetical protein [Pseudofrankia asymbiotica]ONH26206.1 hypothetical protein BL253_25025 [Pseudofrankia asymbiotica]